MLELILVSALVLGILMLIPIGGLLLPMQSVNRENERLSKTFSIMDYKAGLCYYKSRAAE